MGHSVLVTLLWEMWMPQGIPGLQKNLCHILTVFSQQLEGGIYF